MEDRISKNTNLQTTSVKPELCSFRKQAKGMSLSICFAYNDEVYIASDSRSSVVRNRSLHNRIPTKTEPVDDEFHKITPLDIAGNSVVAVSTGTNRFGVTRIPISEMLCGIDYSEFKNVWEAAVHIKKRFAGYPHFSDGELTIDLFYFEENGLCCASIDFSSETYPVEIHKHIQPTDNSVKVIFSGVGWARSIAESYPFPAEKAGREETIEIINDFYSRAEKISELLENSIGGPVCIGLLSPKGFEWLQNGYENEDNCSGGHRRRILEQETVCREEAE